MKACGADLGEIVIFDQHHREADLLETLSMREGTEGELLRVLREGVKLHGIRLVIIRHPDGLHPGQGGRA